MSPFGFNLTGGGARGAFQAGVLLGLAEILAENNQLGRNNPIRMWSGTSAGAINSTFMAAHADNLLEGAEKLVSLWKTLTPDRIYETNIASVSRNSLRWVRDLTFGPLLKKKWAQHLLDTAPLLELLQAELPFEKLQKVLQEGYLDAVTCSSYCYSSSETVTFLQSNEEFHWNRRRRRVENLQLTAEHILASCSIPLLFPPTSLNENFFGDGGFRNTAPLSPTIKLGAEKLLMIGVKYLAPDHEREGASGRPTVGHIAGSALNALFMDNLELDLDRLAHINEIVDAMGGSIQTHRSEYRKVNFKMIRPSQNISKLAQDRAEQGLPNMIQYLLSGLGSQAESSDLASYILFEPQFITKLIELGYSDVQSSRHELKEWLLSQ